MKLVKRRNILVLVVLFVAVVGMVVVVNRKTPANPAEPIKPIVNSTSKTKKKPLKRYSYPVRLKIEAIGVNANVQYVGMTDSGELATPSNITDVGWYKLGTRPGNPGSAVLDGHFNGPQGQAGVFSKLTSLKKGDKVTTIDSKGEKVVFTVTGIRTYGADEKPDEVFKSDDVGTHLNLITCSGDWNAESRGYSTRTVVFTSKLES